MKPVTIEKLIAVTLHSGDLATAFCEMDAKRQAEFFIACARLAKSWDGSPAYQWRQIGQYLWPHPDAIEMLTEIKAAAEDKEPSV